MINLEFIRLLTFISIIGVGIYFLAQISPDEPQAIPSEQEIQPDTNVSSEEQRPEQSDPTSEKLIDNYLTASGGTSAHVHLKNIIATGTIVEGRMSKKFELIETRNGERLLTYSWKHQAQNHKIRYASDGIRIWQQQLLPEELRPNFFEGPPARHFAAQRWLIQPFIAPLEADFVFKYQGKSKVSGRKAYIVTGFGRDDERSWFYFDEENFLLTRWGGKSSIAGVEEYIDYRATEFAKVAGVLLPKKIELLLKDSPYGTITFDDISVNQAVDPEIFAMPPNPAPILRQADKTDITESPSQEHSESSPLRPEDKADITE